MAFKKSMPPSLGRKVSFAVLLVLALAAFAVAQDPTGRPDPKGKKPPVTPKKPVVKPEPVPVTVTLTVLTTPPGSTVLVNGEERGVTNAEGKTQFEKLSLGHYSVEVRKDGYSPMVRGFEAGTESPTASEQYQVKLSTPSKLDGAVYM